MSRPPLTFPDLELWMTGWLRSQLRPHWSVFVSNRLVAHEHEFAVIVRDDSGPDHLVTASRMVGVRVIGGPMERAGELARLVASLIRVGARIELGNPLAAVDSVNGPYRVDATDQNQSEYYLTAGLTVLGEPIP